MSLPEFAPAILPTWMWEVSPGAGSTGGPGIRAIHGLAGICSCNSGIRAIHGRQKKRPPRREASWSSQLEGDQLPVPMIRLSIVPHAVTGASGASIEMLVIGAAVVKPRKSVGPVEVNVSVVPSLSRIVTSVPVGATLMSVAQK